MSKRWKLGRGRAAWRKCFVRALGRDLLGWLSARGRGKLTNKNRSGTRIAGRNGGEGFGRMDRGGPAQVGATTLVIWTVVYGWRWPRLRRMPFLRRNFWMMIFLSRNC